MTKINTYSNLIKVPTSWVFLLAANTDQNGERHLIDLAWGLKNLLDSGVNFQDIYIFLDSQVSSTHISNYLNVNSTQFQYQSLDNYMQSSTNLFAKYTNVIFFTLGHGSKTGLDSNSSINPYQLIKKIKDMSGPTNAVLYLGQCYAGIFNYLKVGVDENSVDKQINISIIGATEFQNSISLPKEEILYNGNSKTNWIANIFMYYLFQWFRNPVDIDGDGTSSILDSYKYTEIETSQYLSYISSVRLHIIGEHHGKRAQIQVILQNNLNISQAEKDALEMELAGIESQLNEHLNLFTNKQEGWLLNANHARNIGF